jgi:hypothetical protein
VEKKEGVKTLFCTNGFEDIVLTRHQFVSDVILIPKDISESRCNHYFRSPYGNGKTSFLMLLGKELLENRNCSVYFIKSACDLDKYTESSFHQAREESLKEKKILVILIDEVPSNMNSGLWLYFRKTSISTVVVGVGIPKLESSSNFFYNYSSSEMNFDCNSEDMKDLIEAFVKQNGL